MRDIKPLQDVGDDLAILWAVGEILEDITGVGGNISAEAIAGIGTLMRRTVQRIRQAHAKIELSQQ